MTCCIAFLGPIFNYYFGNKKTMLLMAFDVAFRFYSLPCIHTLYQKFKYEHHEREKMDASEKAFASYGTVDDHPSTTEASHSRRQPPQK
jgi:hypothetical protein